MVRPARQRVAAGLLAALFASWAAFQLNDPDPYLWAAAYGSAAAVCAAAAFGRSGRLPALVVLAVTAVVGLVLVVGAVAEGVPFFEEVWREGLGLIVVAASMAWVAMTAPPSD